MRHRKDYETNAADLISNGMKLPVEWQKIPELESRNVWYMDAFRSLSTCRSFGMVNGPIPWLAVQEYCDREEIQDRDNFWFVISLMDTTYINYLIERQEKESNK